MISIDHKQAVLVLTLKRSEKKNAITLPMYAAMADALEKAKEDESLRAVLIRGEGADFTAGNDISVFAEAGNEHLGDTVRFMHALKNCPLPVVAQVQGRAIGIGTTLLLHCDLVYCADNAQFSLPFVDLALVPEYASSYLLPKLVGHRKAAEWLMLAEPFGAEEAREFGLVNAVISETELEASAWQAALKLAAKPKYALALTKKLMKYEQQAVTAHMNEELDFFLEQVQSPAAKEAFQAFLEKRTPDPKIYQ
ncbi:2-(1,2-epoxy-1,2-dihydrophenyl)acetyl-CoA isomerase [Saliniradius amylolyticus]|uniref:2-(1,2-epoxy-1,2-dihydrophenyl)acetyl-CoA isomerase n=1 Tax=Saliniradius amylolyticus TaxID=2183582 RepID=A0A2S2E1Y4_9ALTE|nr:enoyl-CoA hydratase [Saliniradius amylolyticus]AWL11609.1 2-(1,2-epoxy-1,2-dihydrophenyl)acetyl-CoA isomerase [Saliniradius amylolyticus]